MTRKIILILSLCSLIFSYPIFGFAEEIAKKVYIGDDVDTAYITQKVNNSKKGSSKPVLLRLSNSHFDPLVMTPEPVAGIKKIQATKPSKVGYYIIQFDGPIRNSWKNRLKNRNIDVFDYIPDFAFIVRMNSNLEQSVRNDPHVRWLGIYQPSYKVSQRALDKMYESNDAPESEQSFSILKVTVFPGEDLNRIKSEIAGLGGNITDEVTTKWKTSLKLNIPSESISSLAEIIGFKWIEPVPEWKLHNNISTDIMAVRTPRDIYGLYGEGQTVAVCDTGLDQGSTLPASLHDDFEDGSGTSRVLQIFDRVGDGANDINSGHGTHVSGSVLGNGINSGSDPSTDSFPSTSFAGTAPKANLIVQAVENNTAGTLSGLPLDLNTLFDQAQTAGADLHTNSWGSDTYSTYTLSSEDVDQYIWDHKDFLILFSAGNEGMDKNGDGIIDLYSIGSPATAKNCLTVGASEGDRPSGAGYDFQWATGSWAVKYSADPIFSDHVSDDPYGMAAFSSRGPVYDGRYKPDIVAPGTNILSTRSSVSSGSGWGGYNSYYLYMGGTSMSTPLTAGTATLMREYLMDIIGFTNPSAALIKAALINSAEDISPGQYGTGAYQEIPDSPVPNNVEGWGRVNLANGVYPVPPFDILYYDDEAGLNTSDYQEYTINIIGSSSPLKINLVWTDYPGTTAAHGGLVNDLDLEVTDPSAADHYPDGALNEPSLSIIAYDDDSPEYTWGQNKLAVRFTPPAYPVTVASTSLYFYNPTFSMSPVDVVVYDDDGAGGMPGGTELFRTTFSTFGSGWITIGIGGVVISSGDFFIAVEKNDANQKLVQDDVGYDRSYYYSGSSWYLDSGYQTYIRANVVQTSYSSSYDRTNNVIGLTLNNPDIGPYTVTVSGYNVPQGPQPYALVVSGNIGNQECTPDDTEPCDTGLSGVCADGTRTCDADGFWGGCIQDVQASEETCDNLDNDCNGSTDDNLIRPTTCGVGECGGNTGEETCLAGTWGGDTCDPLAGASAEVCDNLDNDCEGSIDNGCDDDGDGYCDETMTVSGAPVAVCSSSVDGPGDDCDDLDLNIYPGGPEVRIVASPYSYYYIYELQSAYNDAGSGDTIQSKVATYTGFFTANDNKSIDFEGGYTGANNCGFSATTGETTVSGNVTISSGTVQILNGTLTVQ